MPPSNYAKLKEATERYKEFTGHTPEFVDTVELPAYDVGLLIGSCEGLMYTTERDGETEKYIHEFDKKSRPQLISSFDGKQLFILGGGYTFTERGIVDH